MADLAQVLDEAKAFHRAGQLPDAERCYRQALAEGPPQAHTVYLLGAVCHAQGRTLEATELLRQAVQLDGAHAAAWHHLGVALLQQGQLEEAVTHLAEARRLKPESGDVDKHWRQAVAALNNERGMRLEDQGRLSEAEACYREALSAEPTFVPARGNLGNVLKRQGHFAQSEACYRGIVELAPEAAQPYNDLGNLAQMQGRLDEAVRDYRRAVELDPRFAEAHSNLGTALAFLGQLDEAESNCRRAVELKPDSAEAHAALGGVLKKLGRIDEAMACCVAALRLAPDFMEGHNNLGVILAEQEKFDEAIACYQRALALDANYHQAQFNLAEALSRQNKLAESEAACRRAIELKPDDAESRFLHGVVLLGMGRLAEGWPEYEWRVRAQDYVDDSPPTARWDGAAPAGRTILLRCEQGFGDAIQFLRYAEMVKTGFNITSGATAGSSSSAEPRKSTASQAGSGTSHLVRQGSESAPEQQGATVVVECPRALAALAATVAGVDRVVVKSQPRGPFDLYIPLLSLPGIFGTTLQAIPCRVPYVSADPDASRRWHDELAGTETFKIGIAWQGNPGYRRDHLRSIALGHFTPLAELPGVRVYSLQTGPGREQLAALEGETAIVDLGDRVGDFYQTAAVLENLDLLISSDNALVHLAGALGVKVWVALPFAPDWRWMQNREDSPWYPTMRLYRQPSPGDWQSVFQKIEGAVAARG